MQLELRILQQKIGVTTVLVTHDQSEALSMSDRIVVIDQGRAIQIDTPLSMYEAPGNAFVSGFVGKTNLFRGEVTGPDAVAVNGHTLSAGHQDLPAGTLSVCRFGRRKSCCRRRMAGSKARWGRRSFTAVTGSTP